MPRIRLRVHVRTNVGDPCAYRMPGHPPVPVPLLRLASDAQLHSPGGRAVRPLTVPAMIDTGAWPSAVRFDEWREYDRAGLVEHLPFPDGRMEMTAGFAGSATGFRLGRLRVGLVDTWVGGSATLPAVPVVAQLLLNPRITERQMPYPILLGLHLGVLDGRRLTREPVPPAPAAAPTTDVGCAYGQEWYLQDV